MPKIVFMLLLCLLLAGCEAVGRGIAAELLDESRSVEKSGRCVVTGYRVPGTESHLHPGETVKILMIHGIGTHSPGYSLLLQENLAKNLGLNVMSRTGRNIGLRSPEDPQTALGNLRVTFLTDEKGEKRILFYERTWSEITRPQKELLAYDYSSLYAGRLNRFLSGEEVSLPAKIGRGLFAYFAGTVIADLVASVATLPFGIYHFNQLDYYSSLTNLLSGPLIGFVIMPFVLVFLLAMPFGLEWLPLKIVGFGLSLTNRLTVWVASLPHATGGAVSMPVWALVLISLGGLWLCLWRGSWRIWGTAAVVVGMLAMAAVDKPDIIVDRQGKTMVVLNRRNGKYFFLPGASRWNKQNWLSKYAAEEEKNRRDIYNPLYPGRVEPVPGRGVLVDGRFFDRNETLGAGFYERDGHLRMETVRGYIGRRPWNR